uniref:ATP synthase F0 subunit 8 n=1 Tax=Abscondita anceyi TaxID=2307266 RepID=A0A346T616_9COLE|nr:ATP synthase F0 subunit 8 [Abscondita anceyi]AXU05699.1 ATP synthase F0 subunit 8 [Abscondita anceyi]
MAPLSWLNLFIFFIFIFLMFNMMNYFSLMYQKKNTNKKEMLKNIIFKW